jgi:ribosomal peptide maturation radical SAM protein 1
MSSVALVNMPFAPADRASVQIAILRALLQRAGIESEEVYANLELFDQLRQHDAHAPYSSTLPALIGEWLFSRQPAPAPADVAAAADQVDSPLSRLASFAAQWGASYEDLLQFREVEIPAFLSALLDERDWGAFSVVAFTLTYPQIAASLRLAEELKARHPHLRMVFGGALSQIHADSATAYLEAFDFVDHFVVGEAEPVFAPLCAALLRGDDDAGSGLAGVYSRRAGVVETPGEAVALCERFDDAPFPDYRGFAAAREALPAATRELVAPDIPVEMARGCVWAVKKVCSFCGFYPDGGYRRKSNDTAIAELLWQQETLGWRSFYSLDAYIPHGLLNGVFRRIPDEAPNITFPFIELRTKMRREEIELLVDAGVTLVQPGVECLEEGLLDKILKGVTLTDNLFFLKWCRELDLACSWNLLLGLPDATVDEMERQLSILELVPHLAPPAPTRLLFVRGSTYQLRPDDYGLTNLRPDPFYELVWPEHLDLERVAYEIVGDWDMSPQLDVLERTTDFVARWRARWADRPPRLTWEGDAERVVVDDGRAPGAERSIELDGLGARVFLEIVDQALGAEALAFRLKSPEAEVGDALRALVDARLVLETRGRYLALPTAKKARTLGARVKETQRRWRRVAQGSDRLTILGSS